MFVVVPLIVALAFVGVFVVDVVAGVVVAMF